jgi:hypothetical protein
MNCTFYGFSNPCAINNSSSSNISIIHHDHKKKHLEIGGLYKMRVIALIGDHPHTL